VSFDTVKL